MFVFLQSTSISILTFEKFVYPWKDKKKIRFRCLKGVLLVSVPEHRGHRGTSRDFNLYSPDKTQHVKSTPSGLLIIVTKKTVVELS